MFSNENPPNAETIIAELGDKVVYALRRGVHLARQDYALYRTTFPAWIADSSDRGLANWIHDRLWAHLRQLLDQVPGVYLIDKEPLREMTVGVNYRVRVKRHHEFARISAYETEGQLEFLAQGPQLSFPNMEEIRLIGGYRWDKLSRSIGVPLLSLRDGRYNVLWEYELPEAGDEFGGEVIQPVVDGPTPPTIEIPTSDGQETGESDSS